MRAGIRIGALVLAVIASSSASLSLLLARRDSAVRLLSDQRQRLVAEALTAEEAPGAGTVATVTLPRGGR
jgi:hypothetical protein